MKLPEIRAALSNLMAGMAGVNSAEPYPPNRLGTLPCGVVFHDPEARSTVTMGDSEMWVHRLLCRLYIAPVKNLPDELNAADAFVEPFVAAIAGSYQLGIAGVYGAPVTGYGIGTDTYGGTEYVTVEWPVEVKAKQARSITS